MANNISDIIEAFLLNTLGNDDSLCISRNELASYFACAPSQINYVLSTRFTPDKGYMIESRRGGGGSVTVVRLVQSPDEIIYDLLKQSISDGLTYNRAAQIVERLQDNELLTVGEAEIVKCAVSDKALVAPTVAKDGLRASIMKAILCQILKSTNAIDET